jgi:hypothetical protein
MHSALIGFRYATSRWLALVRRSILSPEKKQETHTISIHAYMNYIQTTPHNSSIEYQKQTSLDIRTYIYFIKENIHQHNSKQFLVAW